MCPSQISFPPLKAAFLETQSRSENVSCTTFLTFFSQTGGVRNISNCLTIETDIDLMSENLKQRCAENGWWTPETPFNWRVVMSDEGDESDCIGSGDFRLRAGRNLLVKFSDPKGPIFQFQSVSYSLS